MPHASNKQPQLIHDRFILLKQWVFFSFSSFFLSSILFASHAHSEIPKILRPGTKASVLFGGIGPSVGVNAVTNNSFTIHNSFGYHFQGNSSGPALGGDFDLRLDGNFNFTIGPRFWWDIQIANMAIYVAPFIRLGFSMFTGPSSVTPAVNFKGGVRGKVILNDKALLFLELTGINANILFTKIVTITLFEYQFLIGGGVTF